MKFSKENQPPHYKAKEPRVMVSARVKPSTRQWLKDHRVNIGRLLDEYVKSIEI